MGIFVKRQAKSLLEIKMLDAIYLTRHPLNLNYAFKRI